MAAAAACSKEHMPCNVALDKQLLYVTIATDSSPSQTIDKRASLRVCACA